MLYVICVMHLEHILLEAARSAVGKRYQNERESTIRVVHDLSLSLRTRLVVEVSMCWNGVRSERERACITRI